MCAIAAIIGGDQDRNRASARNMANAMRHRGPDDQTLYQSTPGGPVYKKPLTVVFDRLAIIDTSANARHPQHKGSWRVWLNGCVYNYRELRALCPEYHYHGHGDTEVLAALIDKYGFSRAIPMLNGMFAILAYDERTGETWCARDRYGIKPLYYAQPSADVTIVASEIKGLLRYQGMRARPDLAGIGQFMTFQNIFTRGTTMFEGIATLSPATIRNFSTGDETQYWEWRFNPTAINADEAAATTCELIAQAVRRQLVSDVPIATWCSGGLDSGAIAMLANKPLLTAGFTYPEFDETPYARQLAKARGLEHSGVRVTSLDFWEQLDATVLALEDLRVGPSYSNYMLYQHANEKRYRVCLQGTGGDELFAGYVWRYDEPQYRNIIMRTGHVSPLSFDFDPDACWTIPGTIEERLAFDANHFLTGVLAVGDKLSGAHGIEDRVPLLDNDLVDFATTLPFALNRNKAVMRDALVDLLPESILARPKRGFTSPEKRTFYELRPQIAIKEILRRSPAREFLCMDIVDRWPRERNTAGLWCVLALDSWCRQFLGA